MEILRLIEEELSIRKLISCRRKHIHEQQINKLFYILHSKYFRIMDNGLKNKEFNGVGRSVLDFDKSKLSEEEGSNLLHRKQVLLKVSDVIL